MNYNNQRNVTKLKGLTPIEYRNQSLCANLISKKMRSLHFNCSYFNSFECFARSASRQLF
ncbi:IS3 family transposase [Holdemanella biformis]|uniref:Integrase catalytic domain-containing protein n=1 Tax=Holdemanella biformis TaxID=1735 RepID=A0A413CW00_9FIRM|nr:hypothetical protein DWV56_03710 [Holdemanella biformis]